MDNAFQHVPHNGGRDSEESDPDGAPHSPLQLCSQSCMLLKKTDTAFNIRILDGGLHSCKLSEPSGDHVSLAQLSASVLTTCLFSFLCYKETCVPFYTTYRFLWSKNVLTDTETQENSLNTHKVDFQFQNDHQPFSSWDALQQTWVGSHLPASCLELMFPRTWRVVIKCLPSPFERMDPANTARVSAADVTGPVNAPQQEEALMSAVAAGGLVSAAIRTSLDSFQFCKEGKHLSM